MRHLIFISLCSLLWTACGNTDNDFDASGTFEATEILVSSEANGKIMELNIEEGDRLDAGAIVGYVDSTQLFLRKMQLSASLRSVDIRKPDIRKQIAVLEQQIATAKTEQQRQENLVRAKAGNQKQLDDIVNNIKYLQKQLDAQYSSLSKTTGGADAEAEGLQYLSRSSPTMGMIAGTTPVRSRGSPINPSLPRKVSRRRTNGLIWYMPSRSLSATMVI